VTSWLSHSVSSENSDAAFQHRVVSAVSRLTERLRDRGGRPSRAPHQPFSLDRFFDVDPMMASQQQHVAQHVCQLASEPLLDLLRGAPLTPGLARPHKERLGQLTDFFPRLQQKPGGIAVDLVPASVALRDFLDRFSKPRQIHTASLEESHPPIASSTTSFELSPYGAKHRAALPSDQGRLGDLHLIPTGRGTMRNRYQMES
jgi:hypothetical protein